MAGYVIHLAIGEEYIRNHKNEIKTYKDFIDGIIFPDSVKDKSLTHYGPKSSQVHLDRYLADRDIKTDYEKGYFLHLVTDYLFYNQFLERREKDVLHADYDYTNKAIEEKFNVKIPNYIKDKVFYKEGIPEILNLKKTYDFIEKTAKYSLQEIKDEVLNKNKYWLDVKIKL